jgi:hypothetical protein
MTTKENNMSDFEKELRGLMKKHGVELVGHEEYDAEENYAGTEYKFEGKYFVLDVSHLQENA